MFQKGNSFGKGGGRLGAGRPSDEMRERCQKIVLEKDLIEKLSVIASGADAGASKKDQINAIEMLLDRGFGKPNQTMEMTQVIEPALGYISAGNITQLIGMLSVEPPPETFNLELRNDGTDQAPQN